MAFSGGSRGANPAMAPPIEFGNGVWPHVLALGMKKEGRQKFWEID